MARPRREYLKSSFPKDYAECVRELVEVYYPQAKKIRLVQDNLNTHDGASLYEAFPPELARSDFTASTSVPVQDAPQSGGYGSVRLDLVAEQ